MIINATLINYLHLCQRKLWLYANVIRMEHTSDLVAQGKHIGESTYPQRAEKNQEVEIAIGFMPTGATEELTLTAKIDFFDAKQGVVHEIKKSAAKENAHIAQVLFYLFVLRKSGIEAKYGIIEYPKFRQTERVELTPENEIEVERWIMEAKNLIEQEVCPPTLPQSKCNKCSYYEFCWIGELVG